jgi:pSer/pThr/pTyr-binding forkhead associated (FHA) protein
MPSLIHKRPDGTEKSLEFGNKPLIIGRLPQSGIQVHDAFISRIHCGIGCENNQFFLKDMGSTNGTYRNGSRAFEGVLSSGDKIQVGNTTLIFEIEPATGNGIIREIPQMGAPLRSSGSSAIPQVSHTNHTLEVNVTGKPPSSSGSPAS